MENRSHLIQSKSEDASVPPHSELEKISVEVNLTSGEVEMRKVRRHFSGSEKVAILKWHLVEKVAVSALCDEHELQPPKELLELTT
jgi:hypothetical protein